MTDERTKDEERADRFFLTDLVNTPVYMEIDAELQAKYPKDDEGELPDQYWEDLQAAIENLFKRCLVLNEGTTSDALH